MVYHDENVWISKGKCVKWRNQRCIIWKVDLLAEVVLLKSIVRPKDQAFLRVESHHHDWPSEYVSVRELRQHGQRISSPFSSCFPPEVQNFTYHESADGLNENLLLLLHGVGDTNAPFAKFGAQMQLPQTAILSLSGPMPLPFDLRGFSWFPTFHRVTGERLSPEDQTTNRLVDFQRTRKSLIHFIETLVLVFGWKHERVFVLGYSEGGCVALDLAMQFEKLGGVLVLYSGFIDRMLETGPTEGKFKCQTPVLLFAGTRDTLYPPELVEKSFQWYQHACSGACQQLNAVAYFQKSHEMISSPSEMKSIMTFFAQHLYLRNVHLENRTDVIQLS